MCSNCPSKKAHAKGLCPACYQRHRRNTCESARLAHRAANKRWAKANPVTRRRLERKYRYGITEEEYQRLLHQQNNVCAVCLGQWSRRGPCVDHGHTGKVRGILCDNCNKKVGHYEKLLTYPNFQPYMSGWFRAAKNDRVIAPKTRVL